MITDIALKFNEGGIFMWILLGTLGLSFAIFIERIIFLYGTCRNISPTLAATCAKAVQENTTTSLSAELAQNNDPLSPLLKIALDRSSQGLSLENIQDGIDEEALIHIPRLSERLNYLALIANIATLLGLLGTIAGLQDAFSSLASVEAAEKASLLAGGISKAMNTTAFGLIVAIPSMVGYTFLTNKQKALTATIDDAVLRFTNFLKNREA